MMLRDLCDLFDLKRQTDPDAIPPRRWCRTSVGYELTLDRDGTIVSCVPLAAEGQKLPKLVVPMAYVTRSGQKPVPGFLCDDAQHVFGVGKNKFREELRLMHEQLAKDVLSEVDDDGARAYLSMLRHYGAGMLPRLCAEAMGEDVRPGSNEKENPNLKSNLVFRFLPDGSLLHERTAIVAAWDRYAEAAEQESEQCTCLVLGKVAPRAKLFPQVSGLAGAQSAGAALVSCNADAFSSYGQKIATVGSISREAAEKAGGALNYVLKDDSHHMRLGDDYVCFWTNSSDSIADACLSFIFDSDGIGGSNAIISGRGENVEVRDAVQEALQQMTHGLPPVDVPADTKYHVMGIAPYQARLAVRFYQTGSFGDLERNVSLFLRDTQMVGVRLCSLKRYLEQAAVQVESKNLPRSLITSCVRALLDGTAFPDSLAKEIILRTRADHGSRNTFDMGRRAAILRAYLLRKSRNAGQVVREDTERRFTVALNEENENQGYLLGRLFALLDKVQVDAVGDINAGIRERYMGAASTTPARVFPQLLKLAQHHISMSSWGSRIDVLVQRVISKVDDSGFPKTLSYDDQGEFYIGFYQQREALYKKSEKGDKTAKVDVTERID